MKNSIGIGTLALIFMLIIASYFIGINYSKEKAYNGEYRTYTVYKDDTLWGIAQDIDGDTRYIVHIICEDNDIISILNNTQHARFILKNLASDLKSDARL